MNDVSSQDDKETDSQRETRVLRVTILDQTIAQGVKLDEFKPLFANANAFLFEWTETMKRDA